MISIAVQKLLHLIRSHLFIFLLFILLQKTEPRKYCYNLWQSAINVFCLFCTEFYGFRSYIKTFNPILIFNIVLENALISLFYIVLHLSSFPRLSFSIIYYRLLLVVQTLKQYYSYIHEHGLSFNFLVASSIFFISVLQFSEKKVIYLFG